MKKLFVILCVLISATMCYAQNNIFDERGIWHALKSKALAAGTKTTFGLIDVSGYGQEINIEVYGTTPDDSLVYTIDLYGMMSPNLADTAKSVLIYTKTNNLSGGATSHADTLEGTEMFPYLFGRMYNIDGDSTLTVDVWLYVRQPSVSLLNN